MTDREELWPGGPVLRQAAHFRLGTDCVLLADFARADSARRGIDLGCASGAAMLLLLAKEEKLHMTGLEIVPEAAELARENLAVNGLTERGGIVTRPADPSETLPAMSDGFTATVASGYVRTHTSPCFVAGVVGAAPGEIW